MNEEELKAGERYNFTLLYTGQSINNKFRFESPTGIHYILGLGDMEAVSPVSAPSNGIKNTEPAPKYDPCRLFKEGDVAEISLCKGRAIIPVDLKVGDKVKVCKNEETGDSVVHVIDHIGRRFFVNPAFLELVTPVEERVSFRVGDFSVNGEWSVWKDSLGKTEVVSSYKIDTHPNAKAAAEAERDRLNAEYRKELGK